jgi:hypothetical protein
VASPSLSSISCCQGRDGFNPSVSLFPSPVSLVGNRVFYLLLTGKCHVSRSLTCLGIRKGGRTQRRQTYTTRLKSDARAHETKRARTQALHVCVLVSQRAGHVREGRSTARASTRIQKSKEGKHDVENSARKERGRRLTRQKKESAVRSRWLPLLRSRGFPAARVT